MRISERAVEVPYTEPKIFRVPVRRSRAQVHHAAKDRYKDQEPDHAASDRSRAGWRQSLFRPCVLSALVQRPLRKQDRAGCDQHQRPPAAEPLGNSPPVEAPHLHQQKRHSESYQQYRSYQGPTPHRASLHTRLIALHPCLILEHPTLHLGVETHGRIRWRVTRHLRFLSHH